MTNFILMFLIQNIVFIESFIVISILQKFLISISAKLNSALIKIQLFFLSFPLLYTIFMIVNKWGTVKISNSGTIDLGVGKSLSYSYDTLKSLLSSSISKSLIVIWIIGMVYLLTRYIIALKKFNKYALGISTSDQELKDMLVTACAKLKIKQLVQIKIEPAIKTPMLVGLINPMIIMPQKYDRNDYNEYSIYHELYHFKKKDNWVKLLVEIYRCIYWFNPFIHRLMRLVVLNYEQACDEYVTDHLSYDQVNSYCELLITVEENAVKFKNMNLSVALVAEKKCSTEKRIIHMLKYKKSFMKNVISTALVFLAFFIMPANIYATTDGLIDVLSGLVELEDTNYEIENETLNSQFTVNLLTYDEFTAVGTSILRAENQFSQKLGNKELYQYDVKLNKGDKVEIVLSGSPTTGSYTVIIGDYSVTSINGSINATFTTPSSGTYTIKIANRLTSSITVMGFININN